MNVFVGSFPAGLNLLSEISSTALVGEPEGDGSHGDVGHSGGARADDVKMEEKPGKHPGIEKVRDDLQWLCTLVG